MKIFLFPQIIKMAADYVIKTFHAAAEHKERNHVEFLEGDTIIQTSASYL